MANQTGSTSTAVGVSPCFGGGIVGGGAPVTPWILAANIWNDAGIWIDTETWND